MTNYEEKKGFLAKAQNGRCPAKCHLCDGDLEKFLKFDNLDLDHILPICRDGKAGAIWEEKFHEFGNSVLNLRLVPHGCHIAGKFEGNRYTEKEALIFESILRTETFGQWTYGDVVNMRSDLSFVDVQSVIEDVMAIFKSMTEAQ